MYISNNYRADLLCNKLMVDVDGFRLIVNPLNENHNIFLKNYNTIYEINFRDTLTKLELEALNKIKIC